MNLAVFSVGPLGHPRLVVESLQVVDTVSDELGDGEVPRTFFHIRFLAADVAFNEPNYATETPLRNGA